MMVWRGRNDKGNSHLQVLKSFAYLCTNKHFMTSERFTAILEKEGDQYVALCPELDVASQGATIEEAKANLKEAVELFLECADKDEINQRLRSEVFISQFEIIRAA
jgi:predicted RNase H-like HicB family nuclease